MAPGEQVPPHWGCTSWHHTSAWVEWMGNALLGQGEAGRSGTVQGRGGAGVVWDGASGGFHYQIHNNCIGLGSLTWGCSRLPKNSLWKFRVPLQGLQLSLEETLGECLFPLRRHWWLSLIPQDAVVAMLLPLLLWDLGSSGCNPIILATYTSRALNWYDAYCT